MRVYPNSDSKYDQYDLKFLEPEGWMIDLLQCNPSYVHWGPHEDYMASDNTGWFSRVIVPSWDDFEFDLSDYNECVNFYFELSRKETQCPNCKGTGLTEYANLIQLSFDKDTTIFTNDDQSKTVLNIVYKELGRYHPLYKFCQDMILDPDGYWGKENTLNQREIEYLDNKLTDWRENTHNKVVNRLSSSTGFLFAQERCKDWNIEFLCPTCEGSGYVAAENSQCKVSLILWILHPRKGASRGVKVEDIQEENLPEIFEYLKLAQERNDQRFSKICS